MKRRDFMKAVGVTVVGSAITVRPQANEKELDAFVLERCRCATTKLQRLYPDGTDEIIHAVWGIPPYSDPEVRVFKAYMNISKEGWVSMHIKTPLDTTLHYSYWNERSSNIEESLVKTRTQTLKV